MNTSVRTILLSLICSFSVLMTGADAQEKQDPTVAKIITDIDELYRSSSSYGKLEMTISTKHWERTLEMEVWSQGMKKTFIRILAPKKEAGVGTLRVGNEMWNYLPKTNKVIKIPPSMMMSSWMGSDFTNDDLVKEYTFLEDYTFSLTETEDPDPDLLYIRCDPKEGRPIVWGHVLIAVRAKDHLPLWLKYYDEHGTVMRVLEYSEIRDFGGRIVPARLEMIPQDEEGRTIITYTDLEFEADVDEEVFTLRNLRSAR